MPYEQPSPFRPPGHQIRRGPRRRYAAPLLWLTLLVAVAGAVWLWRSRAWVAEAPLPAAPSISAALPPLVPAIRYPIEEETPPKDLAGALRELLGADAVARFLQLQDFPRRFVATVDNLGREQAPPRLWPVNVTSGRFSPDTRGEVSVLGEANAARYRPFVALAERLDTAATADLYRRIYPQLQSAYEELGFRNRYLNDRVVEIIDLMLATPEPAEPPRLELLKIQGPMADPRPWVRWEYVDPQLRSLPAGQKIMLRIGPDNRQRIKRKLAQLRAELTRGDTTRR